MRESQRLWWEQVRSDFAAYQTLRRVGDELPPCHQLHYIQMVTEKLAKAYRWRDGPPSRSHVGFVRFLQLLVAGRPKSDAVRVVRLLGFARVGEFERWLAAASGLAHAVERLAPDLADDGPNPEYPWPQAVPTAAPANYSFEVWQQLQSPRGRQFLQVLAAAVREFPAYA